MRPRTLPFLLLALLVAGCGGGSHASSAKAALAHVAIDWPEVARGVQSPGSAHLASIELASTGATPAKVTFSGVRPTGTAATTATYAAATVLPTGIYLLTVHFMTNVDGTGVETATATAVVSLRADGSLVRPDGTLLGSVASEGKVASVSVAPDQRVAPGDTIYVVFSAQDASGKLLGVSLDAATISVVQNTDKAEGQPYARVKGLAFGTAVITVAVDGVVSPITRLTVDGVPIVARDVALPTDGLVADPARGKLWVSLPAGTVADLDPASGTLGTPITVGDGPGTLALTDDDSTLYVGLLTDGAVRPVDLASRTPGSAFALGSTLRSAYPYRIVPAPGSDTVVAVTVGETGVAVFDHGVARPKVLLGDALDTVVWTSTSRLVAYSSQTNNVVEEATVDASGLTAGKRVEDAFDTFSLDLRLYGGALYGARGHALDAATLAPANSFAVPSSPLFYDESAGPVVDAAANRVYFLALNGYAGNVDAPRLIVFHLDDHTLVSNRPLANVALGENVAYDEDPAFTLWGAHGLAFRTLNHVYLIDDATKL